MDKLQEFGFKVVVFMTPTLAEENGEVVKEILQQGHQVGVLGDTDISQMTFDEQVQYLGQAFSTIRSAANAPEKIVDFKPYEYKFNQDIFEALRAVHARTVSGVFAFDESYCKCWYAKSLGKITFPYPVEMDMIAVPISELNGQLLDSSNSNLFEDAKLKLQEAGLDPVVLSLEPSRTDWGEFEKLLVYVNSSDAKIEALPNLEPWIKNLGITAPSEAAVGEDVTLAVSYTSTKYCPYYRFHIYGKYEGQNWKLLDNYEHCYFVRIGSYSFTHEITIPEPPEGKDTYTVRVVGRASFGGCGKDWPTADNYEAVDEAQIEISKPKLRLLFVPVNWAGTRNFDDVVRNQTPYFFDQVPLGSCPEKYKIYKEASVNFAWPSEASAGLIPGHIESALRARGVNLANYDRIIGLTERSPYLAPGNRGVAGVAGPRTVWVSTACRNGTWDDSVTAHELGHTFRLVDEYCSVEAGSLDCRCNKRNSTNCTYGCRPYVVAGPDVNPLDDPQADCRGCTANCSQPNRNSGYYVCCSGNPVEGGGRCIMAAMCGPGPRRLCHACVEHLASVDQLQCDTDGAGGDGGRPSWGKVINIGLLIGQDGSVTENYVEVIDGIPTSSYVTQNASGNYTLQIVGDSGVLWSFPFNPQLYYYGPVDVGIDYSDLMFDAAYMSLSIPYTEDMMAAPSTSVELYHDESLVFSKELPVGAITGEVTTDDEEPVEDALVQLSGPISDSMYTDEGGTYNFSALGPGGYSVLVSPNPYDNLMQATATASVSVGDTITLNFTLQPAGTIAGEVTNVNKEPLESIQFHLGGYEPPIYASDESGSFAIPYLAAGSYRTNMIAGHGAWYLGRNSTYSNYGDSMPLGVTLGNTTWIKLVKIAGTDYRTVTTSTNTGKGTVVVGNGYLGGSLTAVDPSDLPNPPVEFPHGLFSFSITGLTLGQAVNVTLVLPYNLPAGSGYWKHSTTQGWYRIPMGSNDGDNIVTMTLQDGGAGDDDGTANGVIQDAGGPGIAARIAVETREVNAAIMGNATLTLYEDDVDIASTVSNATGNYELAVPELGDYNVTASKGGFRSKTRTIAINQTGTYTLDFVGDNGLIPNAPNMSYVLACINKWKFGEPPCNLNMSTVLAVINAWKFPI
jgi:hypothetical protein